MSFEITMQSIFIGSLEIRFYSLMILSGIMAGVIIGQREARRLGEDPAHIVNIAVVTGVAPTKGIALPLVSAGGTGWVMTAFCMGLLVSMAREQELATDDPRVESLVTPVVMRACR